MEVYGNWKLLKSSINLLKDVSHLSYVFIVSEEIKSIIEISKQVLREEVERRTMCVLPVFLNHRPNQLFTQAINESSRN